MSDANRTRVSVVREASFNSLGSTPAWRPLRITGANLSLAPRTEQSQELVADRQVRDLIRVALETGGGLPMEWSFGAADFLLEGAFYDRWQPTPVRYNDGVADSVITDVTTTVVTVLANASDPEKNFGAFAAGHLVRLSGFGQSANNGLFRASAASATSFTTTGLATEAAPPASAKAKVVGIEGASGDIQATATPSLTTTALNFINLGVQPGDWIKVGGTAAGTRFTNVTANNGWVRVAAVTATALILDIVPAGWGADTGSGKTIRLWLGDRIRNGVTPSSYGIELAYLDLTTPEYDTYSGQRVASFDFEVAAERIITATVAFMGANGINATSRVGTPTDKTEDVLGALPRTGEVYSASANVALIGWDGQAVTGPNFVQNLTLSLSNNLRRQPSIGTIYAVGIGAGRCVVTGKLTTYYGSNAIRTKLLSGAAASMQSVWLDPNATRAYVVDIPRLKLTEGSPAIPGVDQDRILDLGWQGLAHPTLGYTLQMQRFVEIET